MYRRIQQLKPNTYISISTHCILFFMVLLLLAGCGGLGQEMRENVKNKVIQYDPIYKTKLSSRSKTPRMVTSAAAIPRSGYVRLGTIYVEYVDKTCFRGRPCHQKSPGGTPTQRLLREAAEHGGDVVVMGANNIKTSGYATMNGACISWKTITEYYSVCRRRSPSGWCSYSTTESRTRQVCTAHVKIPGTKYYTYSRATIWRHDPKFVTRVRYDGMFYNALRNGRVGTVRDLLARGIPANQPDLKGRYPIVTAANANQTAVVRVLLDKGADPAAENSRALVAATRHDNAGMVRILLAKGADPNARIGMFKSARKKRGMEKGQPLIIATRNNNYTIAKLLLDKGANANVSGGQPLKNAIYKRNFRLIGLLLDKGANPNKYAGTGSTPLMTAIGIGNAEIVELLIKKGASVNKRPFGSTDTPLIVAVKRGHVEIVRV